LIDGSVDSVIPMNHHASGEMTRTSSLSAC